jgi:hypothetical protein
MSSKEVEGYFFEHVAPFGQKRNFYTVAKPLRVFKKVSDGIPCIANLIIPEKALVYAPVACFNTDGNARADRKMRASEAYVHSIWTLGYKHTPEHFSVSRQNGKSMWDNEFVYSAGFSVRPVHKFSLFDQNCDSGIHFFLDVHDAIDY